MTRRGKISVKQLVLFILLITGIVFLAKCTIGYIAGAFGSVSAEKAADFLKGWGWEVDADKVFTEEITIPKDFSEVYERYNAIQLKQGYDLTKYRSEKVVKYTFVVKNYKGFEHVEAHVLTWGGRIIGGDLCSTELNGFMTGFDGETS